MSMFGSLSKEPLMMALMGANILNRLDEMRRQPEYDPNAALFTSEALRTGQPVSELPREHGLFSDFLVKHGLMSPMIKPRGETMLAEQQALAGQQKQRVEEVGTLADARAKLPPQAVGQLLKPGGPFANLPITADALMQNTPMEKYKGELLDVQQQRNMLINELNTSRDETRRVELQARLAELNNRELVLTQRASNPAVPWTIAAKLVDTMDKMGTNQALRAMVPKIATWISQGATPEQVQAQLQAELAGPAPAAGAGGSTWGDWWKWANAPWGGAPTNAPTASAATPPGAKPVPAHTGFKVGY